MIPLISVYLIATMATVLTCDVCQVAIVTQTEDGLVKREINYFPGSEGCPSLNKQLRLYFVARKLLRLSETEYLKGLISLGGLEYEEGDGLRGELCERCEAIVNEAVELQGKVAELQGKIGRLGRRLEELRRQGRGDGGGERIRLNQLNMVDAVIKAYGTRSVDRRRKPFRKKQKQEVPEIQEEFIVDDIGFGIFTDDSKVIPEQEEIEERSAKKKVVKYKDEDLDSDYQPDEEEDVSDEDFVPEGDYDDADEYDNVQDQKNEENDQKDAIDDSTITFLKPTDELPLKSRIVTKEVGKKFEFQCPTCSRIFASRTPMHLHIRQKHGYEMLYPCPQCPDLKFTRMELRKHRSEVHEKVNQCHKCGKVLACRRTLEQHFRLVHKMKISFPCNLCDKVFSKKSLYTAHKLKAHRPFQKLSKLPDREPENDEERFWVANPCQICGKAYLSGKTLSSHLQDRHEGKLDKKDRSADKKIKCFFCWKTFILEQRRWVHVKMHHPDIPLKFPCTLCPSEENVTFPSTSELQGHYESLHELNGDQLHKCSRCSWSFVTEDLLKTHFECHIQRVPEINDPKSCKFNFTFKCWFCWDVFPTEEKRQTHLNKSKRHLNRKLDFPCELESCPNHQTPFTNVNDLNIHIIKCHKDSTENSIHQCSLCSWSFLNYDLLQLHKLNHIPRKYRHYKCPECETKFIKLNSLKDHYNVTHGSNADIHKCEHCPMRFNTLRGCSKHAEAMHKELLINTDEGATCDQCGNIFKTAQSLAGHIKSQHQSQLCKDCGLEFATLQKLRHHRKRAHVNQNEVSEHLCPECGKTFKEKHLLKKHMVFHGDRKVKCEVCGMKTWTMGILRSHMRLMHGENAKRKVPKEETNFPCQLCDKGYSRKDSLDDHLRRDHSTNESHRVFSCPKCGKRFSRKGDLDKHVGSKGCSKRWN